MSNTYIERLERALETALAENSRLKDQNARLSQRGGAAVMAVDPFHCSCTRYPNGGRKEDDPQCPLHKGDPRD